MSWVYLDNRLGGVLVSNQAEQRLAGVGFVRYYEFWITSNRESRFPQDVTSPLGIVNVARADVGCYREFMLTVHQQMQLVTQDELGLAVGVLFDRPAGVFVRGLGLATIDPSLESGAVDSYPVPESRKFGVAVAHQGAGHVLQPSRSVVFGEPSEEAAEGSFVGNSIAGSNPTRLSNEGVVLQRPDQCPGGWQTEDVLSYKALPEDSDGVSLWASAGGANKSIEERRIVKPVEKGLKLSDDGGWLNQYRNSGIIKVCHWKMHASFWRGAVGVDSTCGPALFTNKCTGL
jgi:hypothetical protein